MPTAEKVKVPEMRHAWQSVCSGEEAEAAAPELL